jgi:hypothetical protein
MTPRARSTQGAASVALADLPDDVRKQLEKKTGRKIRGPRKQWPVDEVRRYTIRCLTPLADLTQGQRRRVLAHAAKLNDV